MPLMILSTLKLTPKTRNAERLAASAMVEVSGSVTFAISVADPVLSACLKVSASTAESMRDMLSDPLGECCIGDRAKFIR